MSSTCGPSSRAVLAPGEGGGGGWSWSSGPRASGEGEVLLLVQPVPVFVLLKQLRQTPQVRLVQRLDVLAGWTGTLGHRNGRPH